MPRVPPPPPPTTTDLTHAIAAVPPGRWAVGVSGGADSVALLLLLLDRPDLQLHVVHLDHETRAGASAQDAAFVRTLCERLNVPCTIETRSRIEVGIERLDPNPSARFRAARLALFEQVIATHGLGGAILAHHADDQAETVMHRLLRGTRAAGLGGMSPRAELCVGGKLVVLRPLLNVSRAALRALLAARGQTWREDESNASDAYERNRIRAVLASRPALTDALLNLARASRRMRDWTTSNVTFPPDALPASDLLARAGPLRRTYAKIWLARAGVPQDRIDGAVVGQLIAMAEDASTPPRAHFPGKVLVKRKRGTLSACRVPDESRGSPGT